MIQINVSGRSITSCLWVIGWKSDKAIDPSLMNSHNNPVLSSSEVNLLDFKALGTLPADMAHLRELMARMVSDLDTIARNTGARTEVVRTQWTVAPYRTTDLVRILGLIVTSDTAGRHYLQIGNAPSITIRLQANETRVLDLSGMGGLDVARGLDIALVAPSGATAECWLSWRAVRNADEA